MKSYSLHAARLLRTSALGATLAVATVAMPAFAQDTETTDTAAADAGADNEIVVTAQGRAQRLSLIHISEPTRH